jgi:hypothetical protein
MKNVDKNTLTISQPGLGDLQKNRAGGWSFVYTASVFLFSKFLPLTKSIFREKFQKNKSLVFENIDIVCTFYVGKKPFNFKFFSC